VATFYVLVLDIVVNQRKIVYQLQRSSSGESFGVIVSQSLARKQAKGWSERFALGHRCVPRVTFLVDPAKVIAEQAVGLGIYGGRHNSMELILYRAFILGEHAWEPCPRA